MTIPSTAWAENRPLGTEQGLTLDDYIREMKTQLRETIAINHKMLSTGVHADTGKHQIVELLLQTGAQTGTAGEAKLYARTVGDHIEVCAVDESGNETQLTVIGAELVHVTGDETIGGIKTFSSLPILPAADPTTDNQPTRKIYVDTGLSTHVAANPIAHPDNSIPIAKIIIAGSLVIRTYIGTYTGTGVAGLAVAVADLSTVTCIVHVYRHGGSCKEAVRASTMTGLYSAVISEGYVNNAITALTATGFTVGNRDDVNDSGDTYTYVVSVVL